MVPPLADALENLGFLGLSLLAVIGGAVAGALLTAGVVWLACRGLFGKQPPRPVRTLLRWLGALAGALFVAGYLKFGGGSGWLLGSGFGFGPGGSGKEGAQALPKDTPTKPADKATERPKSVEEPPAARSDRVRITVLGGNLVQGRAFYRIEGQNRAVDLKEIQEYIQRRREQPGGALAGVDILIYQDSLGYNTEPVKQLKERVTESGLTPNLVELRSDIPR